MKSILLVVLSISFWTLGAQAEAFGSEDAVHETHDQLLDGEYAADELSDGLLTTKLLRILKPGCQCIKPPCNCPTVNKLDEDEETQASPPAPVVKKIGKPACVCVRAPCNCPHIPSFGTK